jgi:branched-chain amino acid transport system permease protein
MVGSSILAILPELLRFLRNFRLAVNGIILILVVIYLPNGIWDRRLLRRLRRGGGT